MKEKLIVYWSRRDFRLEDNPALWSALEDSKMQSAPFIPLFIIEEYMVRAETNFQFGYPSRFFLAQALPSFTEHFDQFLIARGKGAETLITLSKLYDISIYVNEDVYIDFYKQIKKIRALSIEVKVFKDFLTINREIKSGQGNYYSVFTPFKNAVWQEFLTSEIKPKSNPKKGLRLSNEEFLRIEKLFPTVPVNTEMLWNTFSKNRLIQVGQHTIDLDDYTKLPNLADWYYTEKEALSHFSAFLNEQFLSHYKGNRNSLEKDTRELKVGKFTLRGRTSRMSLALAWGLVSARMLRKMAQDHYGESFTDINVIKKNDGPITFFSELIWREFYKYLYFHNTDLLTTEFQEKFRGTIRWVEGPTALKRFSAWVKGETGYPVVDAAMKQLALSGWMHNRSRMIVASILTKNFGVDWRWGQEYFRSALIDLDETSNNGGWQWGASVGADQKPIRIFNAELQAKNYDASGNYQKKWNGENPIRTPIVEHKVGREEALKRYGMAKETPRDY